MSQGRGVGAAVTKGCTFVSINILRRVPLRRSSQPCTFAIENDYYCATDKLLLSLGADRRCLQGGGCLVALNTLFVTAYVLLCVEQKNSFWYVSLSGRRFDVVPRTFVVPCSSGSVV